MKLELPLAVKGLIPHSGSMLLVDSLRSSTPDEGVCLTEIRRECLLVGLDGQLDPIAYIEFAAQTYAAWKAYGDYSENHAPQPGLLVGIKSFEVCALACIGDVLEVKVRETDRIGGFSLVDADIYGQGERLGRVSLKLWTQERNESE